MALKYSFTRLLKTVLALAALVILGLPAGHLIITAIKDTQSLKPLGAGYSDDASRLNQTKVKEVWPIPVSANDTEQQLKTLIATARSNQLPIAIAGAKHSMGGHTIATDGIVINMLPFKHMSLDETGEVLSVQAGALWSDIIPYLDQHGRSVAIMQSNSSFSVGGSLSVNAHGWQSKRPPIAASVKSFRLLLADGRIVQCSREQNAELFSLALGGYGLFGIILDAQLWTVANEIYEAERYPLATEQFIEAYRRHVDKEPAAEMAFGRLNITKERFLQDAVLTVYRKTNAPLALQPNLEPSALDPLRRAIFRGSVGSDYGKRLRWFLETMLGEKMGNQLVSRNQLLSVDVSLYGNESAKHSDIIHEYFIPPANFAKFIAASSKIIPQYDVDLLNVTLRDVRKDNDSYLRYADQDMIAVVMLFNQAHTEQDETNMQAVTHELIDASLRFGGRYYLPYRPHASVEQFLQAYPQAENFNALKRAHDPMVLFSNQFYKNYIQKAAATNNEIDMAASQQ